MCININVQDLIKKYIIYFLSKPGKPQTTVYGSLPSSLITKCTCAYCSCPILDVLHLQLRELNRHYMIWFNAQASGFSSLKSSHRHRVTTVSHQTSNYNTVSLGFINPLYPHSLTLENTSLIKNKTNLESFTNV